MSKNTSATLDGSVVAPSFKFGIHKHYKPIGEFAIDTSKVDLGKRKNSDSGLFENKSGSFSPKK